MNLKDRLAAGERLPHRAHQLEGVQQLIVNLDPARGRRVPKVFAIFDEVGAGKTKQVIDASQLLYQDGDIDTVLVIAPGFARSTWAEEDPDLGEVAKHAWANVPNVIHEYHRSYTDLDFSSVGLHWVVTNYEFIRREDRLNDLIKRLRGRKTWLVLDESWAVKGFSKQMRACRKLRVRRADRVTILNGTPLSDGKPIDLFFQFAMLDPEIIGCGGRTEFKSKYCVLGGHMGQQVVAYRDLDELNRRIAPYVLSRRTRDCFDLPPMLPGVTIEARLSDANWKIYCKMRDDLVAELSDGSISVAKQAIVKIMRLSQITSGYLGGLEVPTPVVGQTDPVPDWLKAKYAPRTDPVAPSAPLTSVVREIGREKLDATLDFLNGLPRLPERLLTWCRFRRELERTTEAFKRLYPRVENLKGGQTDEERRRAKQLLAPGSVQHGAVVGNQKAGGASLNFAGAPMAIYLSNGPALLERTQSIGRIERPGATQSMTIVDVVACGPRGQHTIDHKVLKSLRNKEDMAQWTVQQWRDLLKEV